MRYVVVSVSMPYEMRDALEDRAKGGHYSVSEYVRELIRRDEFRHRDGSRQAAQPDPSSAGRLVIYSPGEK